MKQNFMNSVQQLVDMSSKSYSRDKEEKIRLIFHTFAKLVNENGYDKLSTRHIAKAANISVGTIYHYFPGGKHAIASGYMDHVTQQIFDPEMFLSLNEENFRDLFENYVQKHLESHRENLEIHRAVDQAILANRDVYQRHHESVMTNMQKVIDELKHLEIYENVPESLLLQNFLLFFNLTEAIVHRYLFFFPLFESDKELSSFLTDIFTSQFVKNLS